MGQSEVYVQAFPDRGEMHQVSTDGGWSPIWSPDGQSIHYGNGERILAVSVSTMPRFRTGFPKVLVEGQYAISTAWTHFPNFDIAPDGKNFVLIKADEELGRANEVRVAPQLARSSNASCRRSDQ